MSGEAEQIPRAEGQDYPIEQLPPEQQTAQEESMEMGAVADQGGMMVSEGGEVGMGVVSATGDTEMGGEGATDTVENQLAAAEARAELSEECKMFVGGLSWDTTENTLKEYFEQYGQVKEVTIKYDRETQKSRGFAFVHFIEEESVQKALDAGDHTLDDREIDVKKAIPHAQHQAMKNRTKKIFVGGVPTDMTMETLQEYFQQFGEIEEVALVTEKGSSRRRGFIFVTFLSEESVDKCTKQTFHVVQESQVEVKRATPRDNPGGSGRGGGRGGGGGGRGGRQGRGGGGGYGGFGRTGWMPYGQYGNYPQSYYPPPYDGYGYDQYGGHGGNFGGYGGQQGGGGGGGGGRGGGYSRYGPGPVKNYNQHGGTSYHPYSR